MQKLKPNLLTPAILGRDTSFFQTAFEQERSKIENALSDARVLVIGAAGSIGSAFVRELVQLKPLGLHLIDISENNLVEVVRDLRSSEVMVPDDFKTFAIDYGGPEMSALLKHYDYEYVLNFSALKHVRSERDPFTLMRLLDVNILASARLLDSLANMSSLRTSFSVSSDKSVCPANLMGASKAFMERLFLARSKTIPFRSARFANVAFSDGSLLHGFLQRIQKEQPLSAPSDVMRYFITHKEAGQLCILACFVGANNEIFFPKFDPNRDMLTFSEIAICILEANGYKAKSFETEFEAKSFMRQRKVGSKEWACHFTTSDTSGEKAFEEFTNKNEITDLIRFDSIGIITQPIQTDPIVLERSLQMLEDRRKSEQWDTNFLLQTIQNVVPELQHIKSDRSLDQKM